MWLLGYELFRKQIPTSGMATQPWPQLQAQVSFYHFETPALCFLSGVLLGAALVAAFQRVTGQSEPKPWSMAAVAEKGDIG